MARGSLLAFASTLFLSGPRVNEIIEMSRGVGFLEEFRLYFKLTVFPLASQWCCSCSLRLVTLKFRGLDPYSCTTLNGYDSSC